MPFGSQPEVETCRPRRRLHPLGYYVLQHVKVMDAIEAAADNPKVTASPGPTLGDFLVPALRRGSDHSGRTNPLYRSAKADPGRRFHALRDKVIAETSCGRAWAAVRRNNGAPGIDATTLADVEEYGVDWLLDELAEDLRNGRWPAAG
jgi:hypothetical protein